MRVQEYLDSSETDLETNLPGGVGLVRELLLGDVTMGGDGGNRPSAYAPSLLFANPEVSGDGDTGG